MRFVRKHFAALVCVAIAALSSTGYAAEDKPIERRMVEIYRIAPGKHEAFLEFIAKTDEANRLVGLPPRQLYVHSDGGDWDFILIQPAETPPEKAAALDAAWEKVGLPSGADFFLEIRKFIAEHSDTVAKGPTTAADFLASRASVKNNKK